MSAFVFGLSRIFEEHDVLVMDMGTQPHWQKSFFSNEVRQIISPDDIRKNRWKVCYLFIDPNFDNDQAFHARARMVNENPISPLTMLWIPKLVSCGQDDCVMKQFIRQWIDSSKLFIVQNQIDFLAISIHELLDHHVPVDILPEWLSDLFDNSPIDRSNYYFIGQSSRIEGHHYALITDFSKFKKRINCLNKLHWCTSIHRRRKRRKETVQCHCVATYHIAL